MTSVVSDALEEDFDDFFEWSLCGFLTLCPKGNILRANYRIAQWLGRSVEELKGARFSELLTIGGKIYYETHLFPLLRMQGHFDEVAVELACVDGKRLQVFVNAYERRNESGQPHFVRMNVYKASDRQIYEQNLRAAKTTAEQNLLTERETSVLREQFIAVLGHDLRNPVGAITSGAMLLGRSSLAERDKAIVAMMGDSAARMIELIENVMDFARSRMGDGIAVSLQPTLMEPVLLHVVQELRSAWPNRTIETKFALSESVTCDAARISQLLSNLLANALTHGAKESPVYIQAFAFAGAFELSVSNGGTPIPLAALETLFEPFTREDAHASQNGLGLGLYIASEIARAHKGKLSATSTAEETRFTFSMGKAEL